MQHLPELHADSGVAFMGSKCMQMPSNVVSCSFIRKLRGVDNVSTLAKRRPVCQAVPQSHQTFKTDRSASLNSWVSTLSHFELSPRFSCHGSFQGACGRIDQTSSAPPVVDWGAVQSFQQRRKAYVDLICKWLSRHERSANIRSRERARRI